MEMEGEIKNLIMVWTIAPATMCYCHRIGKLIPEGTSRLIALFPAILILLLLPLRLISIHLGGPSFFSFSQSLIENFLSLFSPTLLIGNFLFFLFSSEDKD